MQIPKVVLMLQIPPRKGWNYEFKSSLMWAGARAAVLGLDIHVHLLHSQRDRAGAMPATAHWKHLRCLDINVHNPELLDNPSYIDKLLKQIFKYAPDLEAVRVLRESTRLSSFTLNNVRHLEISAWHVSTAGFEPGKQLPVLETFCLGNAMHQGSVVNVDELSLAGCPKLTHLALKRVRVAKLEKPPACKLSMCQRDLSAFQETWNGSVKVQMGFADHLHVSDFTIFSCILYNSSACGILANCTCLSMRADIIEWPSQPLGGSDRSSEGLASCLTRSMPAGVQPLWGLKVIAITAWCMKGTFPANLPNLEELSIMFHFNLQLSFEDAASTAAKLTDLLLLGHPLVQDAPSFLKLTRSLGERGLTLQAGSAFEDSPFGEGTLKAQCSCVYLKPCRRPDYAGQELFRSACDFLKGLTTGGSMMCRCRVCFLCLERRGCINPA